jgi:hypothetical protein
MTTDRELLAAALRPWVYPDDGGPLYRERMASEMSERIADALLPVVDQIATARAHVAQRFRTVAPCSRRRAGPCRTGVVATPANPARLPVL